MGIQGQRGKNRDVGKKGVPVKDVSTFNRYDPL